MCFYYKSSIEQIYYEVNCMGVSDISDVVSVWSEVINFKINSLVNR